MTRADKKRYFQIILLVLGAGSIYVLPYIRTNFQQPFIEAFGMDVAQMSDLYAMLGLMYIVGYIPSGWVADKFSTKKLIVFSLIATGMVGLYVATIPNSEVLPYVFLIWGISTVLTFWSSIIKAISLLSKPEEQAKVFGLLDGGRGIIEAVLATIGLTIFAFLSGGIENIEATTRGLQGVIVLYSVNVILIGILVAIFLTGDKELEQNEGAKPKHKASLQDFILVIKNPVVWLMSAVIFSGYTLFWTTYYLGGYIQVSFGVSVATAASIMTAMMWMRPIGGIGGGILADKYGKTKIVVIAMLLGSVSLAVFSLLNTAPIILITIFVLFIGLMSYALRGLYWSFLDDCSIDSNVLGVAIGFVSFIGYLPDILIPKLSAPLFAYYQDGAAAYTIYLLVSAILCFIGIFFALMLKRAITKRIKLEAQNENHLFD